MTGPTQAVLEIFLRDAAVDHYGLEVGALLGLPSGTIHPILARLEGVGWLSSGWEQVDSRVIGRPARRYYRLTEAGDTDGRQAVALAGAKRARLQTRLRPAMNPLWQAPAEPLADGQLFISGSM